jgi:hypothetical protein
MDKILIYFNNEGYTSALKRFHQKENAFLRIGIITDELGLFINPDETDFKDAILKAIAEKYKKQNTLNLAPEKLIQLMDIDLKEFYLSVDVYESLKHLQEPDKEKYSTYITTDEQKNRWELANELRNVFENAKTIAPFLKPHAMIRHLYPMFTFNSSELNINPDFILNG